MSKFLFLLVILLNISSESKTQNVRFFYYPEPNVYYNTAKRTFIYYDSLHQWRDVKILPKGTIPKNSPRIVMYYPNQQVWKENTSHRAKYKGRTIAPSQVKPRN